MTNEHLRLFREIIKNRNCGKVVGFGFKVDFNPMWEEIFKLQIDLVQKSGLKVTKEEVMPKYFSSQFTGFKDYHLAGLLDGHPSGTSGECYGETTIIRSLTTDSYDDLTGASIRKIMPDDRFHCLFEVKNTEWFEKKWPLTKDRPFSINDLMFGVYEGGLCAAGAKLVPFSLFETLAFLNEVMLHGGPLESLPSYFSIGVENKFAPTREKGLTLPTTPGWACEEERFGNKYFILKNRYCNMYVSIYPKILRSGEWPEEN